MFSGIKAAEPRVAQAPSSSEAAIGEDPMLENLGAASSAEGVSRPGSLAVRRDDPPIDLVHLARQCQGDQDLEEELLGLFRAQARALAAQLSEPSTMSLELNANIAHKLRGSRSPGIARPDGAGDRRAQRGGGRGRRRDRTPSRLIFRKNQQEIAPGDRPRRPFGAAALAL
jgi:hypothetical protein